MSTESAWGYSLHAYNAVTLSPYAGIYSHLVQESIIAFLESTDFESAIRLTVSLGGDADTMGAITGGIAEAYYKEVPPHIRQKVIKRLSDEFIEIMHEFYEKYVRT
nr:ADP-ribosylglycohydrolase family protein [Bacteroides stercorirosoris]